MRRAEWRRRADDPTSLLGWWWRGVVEGRFLELPALAALAMVVMSRLGLFWAFVPLLLFAPILILNRFFPRRSLLEPLLTEPPTTVRLTAQVAYVRGKLTIGFDEMALCLADGWLVGEGVRSDFALRREDVRSISGKFAEDCKIDLTDGTRIVLRGTCDLERRTLRDWHRAGEVAVGEPTFPPATEHPQEAARWAAWSQIGLVLIFLPSVVAACLHLGGGYGEIRLAFSLLGFALAWSAGRRFFRLGELSIAAKRADGLAKP